MNLVDTTVNIEILQLWLKDHPDKAFVSYLISGWQFCFHTGFQTIPETPFECKDQLKNTQNVLEISFNMKWTMDFFWDRLETFLSKTIE